MKIFLLFLIVAMSCANARSQNQPQANLKNVNQAARHDSLVSVSIKEKLVQLAMQNPSVEIDDRTLTIAYLGLGKAKTNILNQIGVAANLNEYSIQKNNSIGSYYPRYNFGVVLPLGLLTTRSKDIDIARESIGISIAQKNEHDRVLREVVLTKYEDYLLASELLKYQKQLYEDVHSDFLTIERDYAAAKIKVEEYNKAYRDDNTENTKLIILQRNLNVTVLELERYIGVKLEDVLKLYR
jgi:outer membrane protein TolC